jgi:hypothetical protein
LKISWIRSSLSLLSLIKIGLIIFAIAVYVPMPIKVKGLKMMNQMHETQEQTKSYGDFTLSSFTIRK